MPRSRPRDRARLPQPHPELHRSGSPATQGVPQPEPVDGLPRRFFATVELSPDRVGRDMGRIAEEVLQHLTTLPRARVRITVEIDAAVPDGVADGVQRIVTENCQTLKFRSHGFERE